MLANVLVVEVDDDLRADVTSSLAQQGYAVSAVTSTHEAADLVRAGARPDVIVTRADAPTQWGLSDLPWVEAVPVVTLSDGASPTPLGSAEASSLRKAVAEAVRGVRLAHTERLASLGRMSAGIVHEVRNPLTAVVYAVSVVKHQIESILRGVDDAGMRARLESVARTLEVVSDGSDHIASLVRDVQSFAHPDERERIPVDLRRVVHSAVRLGGVGTGYRIEVRESEVPLVLGSPSALAQVVLNLVGNACDAADPARSHVVSVAVYASPDGREGIVEVRDNGTGIAPDVLDRLFEPFFTTKGVGVGTGLGLSLSSSIVKGHGGRIDVESTLGLGSVFRVRLPAVEGTTSVVDRHVVLVGHDPAVERLVRRVLERRSGLRVTSQAIPVADFDAWSAVDVVLCDVDAGGLACHDAAVTHDRSLASKFVFLSNRADGLLLDLGRPVLVKPFAPSALVLAVTQEHASAR